MREVVVLGVGMTRFGKHPDKGLKELGTEAIWNAVEDANIPPKDIPIIYVANAMGQQLTELRGTIAQHVVSHAGFLGMPVIGIIGYLFAGIMGIWLVISILRSGRL